LRNLLGSCEKEGREPGRRVFQNVLPTKNSERRDGCGLTCGMQRLAECPFASIRVHSRLPLRLCAFA
jgi:hypothetical protein